jgi:hypothetical protein
VAAPILYGNKYGIRMFRSNLDAKGYVVSTSNVTLSKCQAQQPQAVLNAIKAKWDATCESTPVLCTKTAGPLGRLNMEATERANVKPAIVCQMANLTQAGWQPATLTVKVTANGVDWAQLDAKFVAQALPSPAGLTGSPSGARRQASTAPAVVAAVLAAGVAVIMAQNE